MMEEKANLFRSLQSKRELLKKLDKEVEELRAQQSEPEIIVNHSSMETEFEQVGIDQDLLVPWTTILKETHGTGTISSMTKPQKDRVDDAVFEFLSLRMHPNDVKLCKVLTGRKQIAALPSSMTEEFEYWLGKGFTLILDEQIDSGMLDKANLDDWKKKKGIYINVIIREFSSRS